MPFHRFPTQDWVCAIGHRGVPSQRIENSVAGFELAAELGREGLCDGVELDVRTTLDGDFVVHHDPALATGELISEIPLSRVRASALPDGSLVPTLIEALEALAGLEVFLEAKALPRSAGRSFLTQIATHPMARCHVHAFDHRIIARLRHLDARLPLGVLSRSYPVDPIAQVLDAGASTLWQEAYLIDEALVVRCRAANVGLIAWTVNDQADAVRLAGLGVHGICGDAPDQVRRAVDSGS